jgi:hypothetical protein
MTFDFLVGFATPGCKTVLTSPQGRRGWFANWMGKRWVALDGYVYMVAVRLLGVTVGVTITRECDNSSLPQFAQSPSAAAPPIPRST